MSGRSIAELIKGLERADRAEIRRAAADSLRRMGPAATPAIAPLIRAAIDIDETVREAALKALEAIDPAWPHNPEARKAFPDLVTALSSWSKDVKDAALWLLIDIGSPAAPALADALMKGEDTTDKIYMMWVLARIGPGAGVAVPGLTRALTSQHLQTRIAAANALAEVGPPAKRAIVPLVAGLSDPYPDARQAMASCLARLGPAAEPGVTALVPLLAARQVGVRKAAADALEQIGPGSVPALIELVQARDVERLKVSLKARSEYSRWFQPKPHDLSAEEYKIWSNRSWGLYDIMEERQCLEDAQEAALRILRDLGPTASAARPAIVQALEDRSPRIRLAAVQAMGRIEPSIKDVAPDLIRVLTDKNEATRKAAAEALASFDPSWASDPAVTDAITDLAGQLSEPGESAVQAFTVIGAAGVPALIDVLESGDRVSQEKAAKSLGQIGPEAEAAVPALTKALTDSHPWVQAEAAKALAKITGEEA